ncbi:hypothetical protein [Marivirga sp.]|uniref:hypothetical protein n=1 Tax=Marivirga sp. TaxID=2018662 RepID=UPI003DA79E82
MTIKYYILILIFLLLFAKAHAQLNYSFKAETGYSKYMFGTIQVDPGPNWRDYNLNNENGVELNIINSFAYKNKIFASLGIGYLNFEVTNGISLDYDFEYLPPKLGYPL